MAVTDDADRFQAIKAGSHLTGAMYMTCCNTPRNIRSLQEETNLVMVMPGPHEPTLDQMNKIMNIWVQHMLLLGEGVSIDVIDLVILTRCAGVKFDVYGKEDKILVHSIVNSNASD